jgi:hypothetical protein
VARGSFLGGRPGQWGSRCVSSAATRGLPAKKKEAAVVFGASKWNGKRGGLCCS